MISFQNKQAISVLGGFSFFVTGTALKEGVKSLGGVENLHNLFASVKSSGQELINLGSEGFGALRGATPLLLNPQAVTMEKVGVVAKNITNSGLNFLGFVGEKTINLASHIYSNSSSSELVIAGGIALGSLYLTAKFIKVIAKPEENQARNEVPLLQQLGKNRLCALAVAGVAGLVSFPSVAAISICYGMNLFDAVGAGVDKPIQEVYQTLKQKVSKANTEPKSQRVISKHS